MKFSVKKSVLVDAIIKMEKVSTRGLKSEFDLACRVTLKAQKDKITILASNGHLNACSVLTSNDNNNYICDETGDVTVDATMLKNLSSVIGGASSKDNLINCFMEDEMFCMKDNLSKAKKYVKIQPLSKHHDFNTKKSSKGFSCNFSTNNFSNIVSKLSKYASKFNYKVKYQMLCFHFLKNETRIICGDGARFGILSYPSPNVQITENEGKKFIFPVDQAQIVSSILDGSDTIELVYENDQTCYIKPNNNVELKLYGIPDEPYIPYELHAYRKNDAKIIADVPAKQFEETMTVVSATRDQQAVKESAIHTAKFNLFKNEESNDYILNIKVDEGRFQCDYQTADVKAYILKNQESFSSAYFVDYLVEIVKAISKPIIRFYCINESKTIIVEPISLDSNNSENNIPAAFYEDGEPSLTFFFAALIEENNE